MKSKIIRIGKGEVSHAKEEREKKVEKRSKRMSKSYSENKA